MTTPNIDTKALRERKRQPIERIRDAFARAHKIATGGLAHYMSIPADAERDVDLILSDAIDELEALRNAAPALLDLADRAQELERDVARADAIALTASKDANELEAERDTLRDVGAALNREVEELRSERDALKAEVERLQIEKQNLVNVVAKLSASEREVERLREESKLLRDEVQEWRESAQTITKFHSERAALRGEEASRG